MASTGLTSDHVNYLIWRYLQESGLPDSALKLQQFWMREPQSLPFASRVDRRALIELLQKGLKYSLIEQSFKSKSTVERTASPVAAFFGTDPARAPLIDRTAHNGPEAQASSSRSQPGARFRASPVNSKPPPPTNGFEPTTINEAPNGTIFTKHEPQESGSPLSADGSLQMSMMDIDGHTEPPPVTTLAEGQSIATQSQNVADLASRSTVFPVAERDNLMLATWNPHNETLALGGNSLCRIQGATLAEATDILPDPDDLVTSLAWHPDGDVLAVAMRSDASSKTGTLSTWTASGVALDELATGGEMIIKLQWNVSGNLLMGIGVSGSNSSTLMVWDVTQGYGMSPTGCDKVILDATWSDADAITVCGKGAIGRWSVPGGGMISWAPKHPDLQDRDWTHVYSNFPDGGVRAYAEDTGDVVVLNSNGGLEILSQVHQDPITSISRPSRDATLMATSSLDGTVKVWRDHANQPMSTLSFSPESPPLAAALNQKTPLLAAANHARLLVWELTDSHVPIAFYNGDSRNAKGLLTNGHAADKDSGIGDDATEDGMNEPAVILQWHPDGRKLAFGVGSQISIIEMPT